MKKWNIPSLTRDVNKRFHEVDDIVTILQAFEVDPARGFLPPKDPIERLHQEKYFIWEDVGNTYTLKSLYLLLNLNSFDYSRRIIQILGGKVSPSTRSLARATTAIYCRFTN